MFLRRLYSTLLEMYPAGFRAQFGAEMADVFAQAAAHAGGQGRARLLRFVMKELSGLIAGAMRERVLHSRRAPAAGELAFPSNIAEAESYQRIVSERVIAAIANHDFENARYYDLQDRKARALLADLRAQAN